MDIYKKYFKKFLKEHFNRQFTSKALKCFSKSTFETSGVPLPCSTSQLGEQFRCSLLPAENQILALKSHFNGEHRFCHLDYSASFHFSTGYIYTWMSSHFAQILKYSVLPFIVFKMNVLIPRCQRINLLEKGTTPVKVFAKMFLNMACQTKLPANNGF